METKKITSLLENHYSDLEDKLSGLSLPKDADKILKVVSSFLDNIFESNGVYRQNLTESEDYILQAVLKLLSSQQCVTEEIAKSVKSTSPLEGETIKHDNATNPYAAIAGAGAGTVVGCIISSWAAVAGAIAGTALALYFSTKRSSPPTSASAKLQESSIDVAVFTDIVENICDSIDGVIETFRTQVKRVANVYERREKPSLASDYPAILEQIANVYKVCSSTEGVPTKVKNAVNMLTESLENYNLKIENGKIVNE